MGQACQGVMSRIVDVSSAVAEAVESREDGSCAFQALACGLGVAWQREQLRVFAAWLSVA